MYDRTIRQIEGVNKIFNISGTLLYPPGFGKTNVGCLIAQKYVDTYQDFKIGIIVHNDIIKKQLRLSKGCSSYKQKYKFGDSHFLNFRQLAYKANASNRFSIW